MPLLRRTHDYHRDVRTVEAAAWTAGQNHTEPGDHPMTRHRMIGPPAASTQPQATNPHESTLMIDIKGGTSRRATCQQHDAKAQQNRLSPSTCRFLVAHAPPTALAEI